MINFISAISPPTNLELQNVTNSSATIRWEVPQEELNCINSFLISWTVDNNTKTYSGTNKRILMAKISKTSLFFEIIEFITISHSVDLEPCQKVNVTVKAMGSKDVGAISNEIHFNTTDEGRKTLIPANVIFHLFRNIFILAPGIANNVKIYDSNSNGFRAAWTDPDDNPQCGRVWINTVTEIDKTASLQYSKFINSDLPDLSSVLEMGPDPTLPELTFDPQ